MIGHLDTSDVGVASRWWQGN